MVFLPNAFTPNNDEINDFFPSHLENVANYKLTIFNRWGEKLFKESLVAWTGTYKDMFVQEGIYLYLFE
jgi:gliding motility-associated-like protein